VQSAKRAAVLDERRVAACHTVDRLRDGPWHAEWRHMIAIVMW